VWFVCLLCGRSVAAVVVVVVRRSSSLSSSSLVVVVVVVVVRLYVACRGVLVVFSRCFASPVVVVELLNR